MSIISRAPELSMKKEASGLRPELHEENDRRIYKE